MGMSGNKRTWVLHNYAASRSHPGYQLVVGHNLRRVRVRVWVMRHLTSSCRLIDNTGDEEVSCRAMDLRWPSTCCPAKVGLVPYRNAAKVVRRLR